MAVRVLAQSSTSRAAPRAAALPVAVLALALLPAALDLLRLVQPGVSQALSLPTALASAAAAAVLVVMWLRFPRAAWLAAAAFAACSSLALRLLGADIAPALSLLSILAIGLGGGFLSADATPVEVRHSADRW
jgi:hypothetical protein